MAEGRHRHRRQRDEPGGDGAAERRPQHEVAAASCANLPLPRPTVRNRQKKQFDNYIISQNFDFYVDNGCFGKNYQSFSGTCTNIDKESGLLIIIPDNLNRSLIKIEVNLHEKL